MSTKKVTSGNRDKQTCGGTRDGQPPRVRCLASLFDLPALRLRQASFDAGAEERFARIDFDVSRREPPKLLNQLIRRR
jgi:hypothetical protein